MSETDLDRQNTQHSVDLLTPANQKNDKTSTNPTPMDSSSTNTASAGYKLLALRKEF